MMPLLRTLQPFGASRCTRSLIHGCRFMSGPKARLSHRPSSLFQRPSLPPPPPPRAASRSQRRWYTQEQREWDAADVEEFRKFKGWIRELELEYTAGADEIARKGIQLIKEHHPDRFGGSKEKDDKTKAINAAKDGLLDLIRNRNPDYIRYRRRSMEEKTRSRVGASSTQSPKATSPPSYWEQTAEKWKQWKIMEEQGRLRQEREKRTREEQERMRQERLRQERLRQEEKKLKEEQKRAAELKKAKSSKPPAKEQGKEAPRSEPKASQKGKDAALPKGEYKQPDKSEKSQRGGQEANQQSRGQALDAEPGQNSKTANAALWDLRVAVLHNVLPIIRDEDILEVLEQYKIGVILDWGRGSNNTRWIEFLSANHALSLQILAKSGYLAFKRRPITRVDLRVSGHKLPNEVWTDVASRVLRVKHANMTLGPGAFTWEKIADQMNMVARTANATKTTSAFPMAPRPLQLQRIDDGDIRLEFLTWRGQAKAVKDFIQKHMPDVDVRYATEPCENIFSLFARNYSLRRLLGTVRDWWHFIVITLLVLTVSDWLKDRLGITDTAETQAGSGGRGAT